MRASLLSIDPFYVYAGALVVIALVYIVLVAWYVGSRSKQAGYKPRYFTLRNDGVQATAIAIRPGAFMVMIFGISPEMHSAKPGDYVTLVTPTKSASYRITYVEDGQRPPHYNVSAVLLGEVTLHGPEGA